MIKYRPVTEMSDEEIEFVVKDLLSWDIEKITSIDRDFEENEIIVEFLAIWYYKDDDGKEIRSLNEEEISISPISARGAEPYDSIEYRKYMLAKGYHPLLKDNKWLMNSTKKCIAKFPIEHQELYDIEWLCPSCKTKVGDIVNVSNYCSNCGKKLLFNK